VPVLLASRGRDVLCARLGLGCAPTARGSDQASERPALGGFGPRHRGEHVIVPQAQIDLVCSPRIRRRVIHLPVIYGQHGERKRCPMREGGVYHLKGRIPYELYLATAQDQPTRARGVLRLIDRCESPAKTVTITVLATEMQDEKWLIRFIKGNHATVFDRPVYLARYGDYTTEAGRQAVPGDPELMTPFPEDLAKARAKALERQLSPQQLALQQAANRAQTLQQSLKNMKARDLVRRAQRNYEAAARILLSDEVLDSSSIAVADGSRGEADRPPHGDLLPCPDTDRQAA
jgi:hypothetical protein